MNEKDKIFIRKYIRLILFILTFWIFIEIVENIFENDIYTFDTLIYNYISKIKTPTLTKILTIFTNVGSGYVMIPICIVSFIFIKNKFKAECITLNLAIAVALNFILKNIFERPRPDGYRLIKASGYSFPSGHSMVSMAFYGFLIYLIFKNIKNVKIKWVLSSILAILIICIGLSRIYLGVHYASDVLGGFLIAVSYLTIFTKFYKIKADNSDNSLSEHNQNTKIE